MKKILQELKEIKKLLQVIVSNQEQEKEKKNDFKEEFEWPYKF